MCEEVKGRGELTVFVKGRVAEAGLMPRPGKQETLDLRRCLSTLVKGLVKKFQPLTHPDHHGVGFVTEPFGEVMVISSCFFRPPKRLSGRIRTDFDLQPSCFDLILQDLSWQASVRAHTSRLKLETIPERVGPALHRELLKNGVTADYSLPKFLQLRTFMDKLFCQIQILLLGIWQTEAPMHSKHIRFLSFDKITTFEVATLNVYLEVELASA